MVKDVVRKSSLCTLSLRLLLLLLLLVIIVGRSNLPARALKPALHRIAHAYKPELDTAARKSPQLSLCILNRVETRCIDKGRLGHVDDDESEGRKQVLGLGQVGALSEVLHALVAAVAPGAVVLVHSRGNRGVPYHGGVDDAVPHTLGVGVHQIALEAQHADARRHVLPGLPARQREHTRLALEVDAQHGFRAGAHEAAEGVDDQHPGAELEADLGRRHQRAVEGQEEGDEVGKGPRPVLAHLARRGHGVDDGDGDDGRDGGKGDVLDEAAQGVHAGSDDSRDEERGDGAPDARGCGYAGAGDVAAADRKSAHEGVCNVGDAEVDEFLAGVDLVAAHARQALGDEDVLEGDAEPDHEAREEERLDEVEAHALDEGDLRLDGRHGQPQRLVAAVLVDHVSDPGREQQDEEVAVARDEADDLVLGAELLLDLLQRDEEDDGAEAEGDGEGVRLGQVGDELSGEVGEHGADADHAEEVRDLGHVGHDAHAAAEAEHDGDGERVEEEAEVEEAEEGGPDAGAEREDGGDQGGGRARLGHGGVDAADDDGGEEHGPKRDIWFAVMISKISPHLL